MLTVVRPRYFVPIHGEYRYLARHARLVRSVSKGHTEVFLMENGDRLCFDTGGAWQGDPFPTGRVLIDGTRASEIADEALRDWHHLAGDEVVVLVAALDRKACMLIREPALETRGLVTDPSDATLRSEILAIVESAVRSASLEERTDLRAIEERIRIELQRFLRRRSGRRPLVLPVFVEI